MMKSHTLDLCEKRDQFSKSYDHPGAHRTSNMVDRLMKFLDRAFLVVLENSNVAQLASNLYLSVHFLPQEDHHDTDDASAAEIYPILMSESTVSVLQSSRRREHCASVVDRHAQTYRTAALHGMRPRVLRPGGDSDGPQQAL